MARSIQLYKSVEGLALGTGTKIIGVFKEGIGPGEEDQENFMIKKRKLKKLG